MALTARQRARLPRSAFGHTPTAKRSTWRYPMPTRAQARRAGISEAQRQRTLSAAKAYSARRTTASSPRRIHPVANRRRLWQATGPAHPANTRWAALCAPWRP